MSRKNDITKKYTIDEIHCSLTCVPESASLGHHHSPLFNKTVYMYSYAVKGKEFRLLGT